MTLHVIPINDSKYHRASCECHCYPLEDKEGKHTLFVHNAFDLREKYERQGILNHKNQWEIIEEI